MHAFLKLRARIFRIRKTRVYDTYRKVSMYESSWSVQNKKKIIRKGRRVIGGKYRSRNGR